jgi:hypothetical protein
VPHRVLWVATRVFLHIGPPKTGTTFIQQVLWKNRDLLKDEGIGIPFKGAWCHKAAARTLRDDREWLNRPVARRWNWDRFVEEVRGATGGMLLSAEDLAGTTPAHVRRAVESLSPAEITVIATMRDLARQLPSRWQNSVKNGWLHTLDEYVRAAMDESSRFWREQDVPAVLTRWLEHVPAERVHVVTVPRSSAEQLWTRFAGVLGVNADAFELPASPANASLGAVQTEVLRKFYTGLGPTHADRVSHYQTVKAELLPLLRHNGDHERPINLPAGYRQWATERSLRMVQELRELGVDLRGDWDDLVPPESPVEAPPPSPEDELAVALAVLRRMLVRTTSGSLG